jgi:hypothetical protein
LLITNCVAMQAVNWFYEFSPIVFFINQTLIIEFLLLTELKRFWIKSSGFDSILG